MLWALRVLGVQISGDGVERGEMSRKFLPLLIMAGLCVLLAGIWVMGTVDRRDVAEESHESVEEGGDVENHDPEKFKREIYTKLQSLVFPEVRLEGGNLGEAIGVLQEQCYEINDGVSFGFVVRMPREVEGEPKDDSLEKPVTVVGEEMSLEAVLNRLCEQVGWTWYVSEYSLTILPKEMKPLGAIPSEDPEDRELFETLMGEKIPRIDWEKVELAKALEFIRNNFAPVEIETGDAESESLITLKKENVPVHEVLNAIGEQAGMSWWVANKRVVFFPREEKDSAGDELDPFQARMREKLNEIVIPELVLENSALSDAVEFLRTKLVEDSPGVQQGGFSFVITGVGTMALG